MTTTEAIGVVLEFEQFAVILARDAPTFQLVEQGCPIGPQQLGTWALLENENCWRDAGVVLEISWRLPGVARQRLRQANGDRQLSPRPLVRKHLVAYTWTACNKLTRA